jgi:putative transposase
MPRVAPAISLTEPAKATLIVLWMTQIGCNLTDAVDGLLKGKRYVIHDRDPLFTAEFLSLPGGSGCCLGEASTAQSQFERACGTICKDDQGILFRADDPFGESAVRKATAEFMAH